MVELIFVACMVSGEAKCKEVRLNFDAQSVSPLECMANGQIAMAQWSVNNPNWRIGKWKCAVAGQFAKT